LIQALCSIKKLLLAHRRYANKGLGYQHITLQNNNTVHLNRRLFLFNKIAAICAAGQHDHLKSASGRIVILTSYMTSLVLLAGYSASLISSLAVQPRHLPFRDLQGLLYDGSYRLGVLQNSFTLNNFDVRLRKLTTFTVNIVPQSALILRHWHRFQLNAMRMTRYINMCVYVCKYVCVCMCVCIYVCVYVYMYVCMYVCMNECTYVCMCVCVYNVRLCLRIYVYMYVYIY
jgi:hypothetical protein